MKGLRSIARAFRFGQRLPETFTRTHLLGKSDLPSVGDFVDAHIGNLGSRDSKAMFTSDPETIDIARRVLGARDPSTTIGKPMATRSFFEEHIFRQPDLSSSSAGSIPVLISDINDFPKYKQKYEAQAHRNVMLCVGGPAAEDQTVMASVIDQVRTRLDDIVYITRDYTESNVNHSAKQSHARHGNALNADSSLSGHRLLPILLMRKLIGVDVEDVLEPDYTKIDVQFTIDPKKLRIYFGNELNWLKQELKKSKGELTEHDINRLESTLSQEILIALEAQTGVAISGGLEKAREDSSSIHVNFSSDGEKHLKAESEDLARVGITSRKLSPEKHDFFFGDNPHIHSAYEYLGDGHVRFDTHQINEELATKHGAQWFDGKEISRIFVRKNDAGNAEVVGVLGKDGEFTGCKKLHITGGYKVDYQFDPASTERFHGGSTLRSVVNKVEDVLGLSTPLTTDITTSTGVSINAVFKKSDRIKRIIAKYGSTGEIAVTNSHWTMIAEDENHVVIRMTGGGNTGSEEYNPAYFLNVLANTRRIFGDDLVGILSTYGCPRAINARNSTEFAEIAEGGIVSYGKGGTGNTKRHAEAAFGLMALGFEKEVVEHFNKFQTARGKPLGDELAEAYKMADKVFFHDNIGKTNRRMGYDSSLSPEEMLAIGGFLTALSYGIYKGVIKSPEPNSPTR